MKDAIVAKVAMQAADFYQEASRAATHYELRGMFEKVLIYFSINYPQRLSA